MKLHMILITVAVITFIILGISVITFFFFAQPDFPDEVAYFHSTYEDDNLSKTFEFNYGSYQIWSNKMRLEVNITAYNSTKNIFRSNDNRDSDIYEIGGSDYYRIGNFDIQAEGNYTVHADKGIMYFTPPIDDDDAIVGIIICYGGCCISLIGGIIIVIILIIMIVKYVKKSKNESY